jgi:RimJ/RimL family protein N-acetyltransferase
MDWSVPRFEIGYWVRRCFVGQGYITEAVRGVTRFAFETLGARRVEIRCDARNERSRRVAERSGFELEATLRNHAVAVDGELRDTLIYARLEPLEAE